MRPLYFKINDVPTVLLGEQPDKLFLFVHGQCGSKEETRAFADVACPIGWKLLGMDLPHGMEREWIPLSRLTRGTLFRSFAK